MSPLLAVLRKLHLSTVYFDSCADAKLSKPRHAPTIPAEDANRAQGERVHEALTALDGVRPLWISCASGARAGAALLIHLGKARDWSTEEAFAWAASKGLTLADPARAWVAACLDTPAAAAIARPTATDGSGAALVFRQLFDATSSTYTYLLGDPASGE